MENFKLIWERENPLFKRQEVQFSIQSEVTPSREEVRIFISEKFSAPVENINIKNILGKFGSKIFTITANIYSSKKDMENIERVSKKSEPEKLAEEKSVETPEIKSEEPVQEENKEVKEETKVEAKK